MHRIEKILRWTAGKDHKGPRIKFEEPILRSGSLAGLQTFRPSPFSAGTFLKSRPDHRPVTKPKLFKPTLYKSYCEGSLPREPKNVTGPRWNRVPTIGAVCGESMRVGAGGGGVNSLASKGSRSFLRLRRYAAVVPT